ncbi:unnamed protein product [Cladocopium goreaui]|uniref:F-box domain-containing protein n=1 Tax=Cladocopium goreaui TaxID=2562237 RepID=A0A9P1FUU1_9DINO|nr:unnamed protein product [Cladocopium goreaui]
MIPLSRKERELWTSCGKGSPAAFSYLAEGLEEAHFSLRKAQEKDRASLQRINDLEDQLQNAKAALHQKTLECQATDRKGSQRPSMPTAPPDLREALLAFGAPKATEAAKQDELKANPEPNTPQSCSTKAGSAQWNPDFTCSLDALQVPAVNSAQKRQTERKVLNCHQYQWTNAFSDAFNEVKANPEPSTPRSCSTQVGSAQWSPDSTWSLDTLQADKAPIGLGGETPRMKSLSTTTFATSPPNSPESESAESAERAERAERCDKFGEEERSWEAPAAGTQEATPALPERFVSEMLPWLPVYDIVKLRTVSRDFVKPQELVSLCDMAVGLNWMEAAWCNSYEIFANGKSDVEVWFEPGESWAGLKCLQRLRRALWRDAPYELLLFMQKLSTASLVDCKYWMSNEKFADAIVGVAKALALLHSDGIFFQRHGQVLGGIPDGLAVAHVHAYELIS